MSETATIEKLGALFDSYSAQHGEQLTTLALNFAQLKGLLVAGTMATRSHSMMGLLNSYKESLPPAAFQENIESIKSNADQQAHDIAGRFASACDASLMNTAGTVAKLLGATPDDMSKLADLLNMMQAFYAANIGQPLPKWDTELKARLQEHLGLHSFKEETPVVTEVDMTAAQTVIKKVQGGNDGSN